jgi:hypothetical protein
MKNDPEFNWRRVGKGPSIPLHHGSMMYQKETGADHARRILDEYAAARKRPGHNLLYVHLHCPNADCCCSNFSLTLKYQYGLGGYRVVHPFCCPNCGTFAVLDASYNPSIETHDEHAKRTESDARRSVWHQLKRPRWPLDAHGLRLPMGNRYRADRRTPDGIVV